MAAVLPLASYANTGHWRIQVPLVPLMILVCFLSEHLAWWAAQVGRLTCQQKSFLFHTPDNSNVRSPLRDQPPNNTFPEILCSNWIFSQQQNDFSQQHSQQHTLDLVWTHLIPIDPLYSVISVVLGNYEPFWIRLNLMKNGEGGIRTLDRSYLL